MACISWKFMTDCLLVYKIDNVLNAGVKVLPLHPAIEMGS